MRFHNSSRPETEAKPFVSVTAIACAIISLACFLVPMYIIQPYRAQGPREFPLAIAIRDSGPILSALCVLFIVAVMFRLWRRVDRRSRFGLTTCLIVAVVGAALTRLNVFELMFHPDLSPDFGPAASANIDSDDMVISFTQNGETHAYPVRAIGYHHIVNDVVGGAPVVATYCTLCHTGIVWSRLVDGRVLTFRLTGIRNGNALLRDEETNSIWQQTTGEAIYGTLKGKHLQMMHSDEIAFALWKKEQPRGLVLKPNPQSASLYEPKDWEKNVLEDPVVVDTSKTGIAPRELMLGIATASGSKAFPLKSVLSAGLIQDHVGTDPVLLIVAPDHLSVRAFQTQPSTTFVRSGSTADTLLTDTETSSTWNFSGCAVSGPLQGQCLTPLNPVKDYWFDWMNYHPQTGVFKN